MNFNYDNLRKRDFDSVHKAVLTQISHADPKKQHALLSKPMYLSVLDDHSIKPILNQFNTENLPTSGEPITQSTQKLKERLVTLVHQTRPVKDNVKTQLEKITDHEELTVKEFLELYNMVVEEKINENPANLPGVQKTDAKTIAKAKAKAAKAEAKVAKAEAKAAKAKINKEKTHGNNPLVDPNRSYGVGKSNFFTVTQMREKQGRGPKTPQLNEQAMAQELNRTPYDEIYAVPRPLKSDYDVPNLPKPIGTQEEIYDVPRNSSSLVSDYDVPNLPKPIGTQEEIYDVPRNSFSDSSDGGLHVQLKGQSEIQKSENEQAIAQKTEKKQGPPIAPKPSKDEINRALQKYQKTEQKSENKQAPPVAPKPNIHKPKQ